MIDFARGGLLGQQLISTTNVKILTAALETEVMLITMTHATGDGTGGTLSLFHVPGGGTPGNVNNIGTYSVDRAAGTAKHFHAPTVGAGIHLARGDELYASAFVVTNIAVAIYGITSTLQELR